MGFFLQSTTKQRKICVERVIFEFRRKLVMNLRKGKTINFSEYFDRDLVLPWRDHWNYERHFVNKEFHMLCKT